MAGCKQTQTLYSNNVCIFIGPDHVADADIKTRIDIKDSVITFTNLDNDSVATVKRYELEANEKFSDGETVYRWKATLNNSPISFGFLKDSTKNIVSVAIIREDNGLVFAIVPKKEAIPNKK